MLLIIDNYDSFTYNLYQYFCELGVEPIVIRNDAITLQGVIDLNPSHIVISPGPCTPDQSGVSLEVIREFSDKIPLLGVCLGHQSIAQVFGAKVTRARKPVHGKTSKINHTDAGLFAQLNHPLTVTRYHSLIVDRESLPDDFIITAWSETDAGEFDEIMGIAHKTLPLHGVQFHPESIKTEQGHQLLGNFLRL
ncbi:anthranilate synthase component II [Vibrio ulleungensis]|uniref:Aminodeoxychorismate/anthranilate synthase component II n=1 Tax=Vibrio ulleungensis TaxID=2807619 RepID=A0ABS2HJY0_9VIBR|nr:aminodeoxychorismate/anthranilate synthase component II [Vibrio ulleungensis]MBM7037810.1 aminodeoxychorismate/anthranilate synthase component II [Vibrio ulleungensis]